MIVHSENEKRKEMRNEQPVDQKEIWRILRARKGKVKFSLAACAHCGLCAESCFLFVHRDGDPVYMPAHKFLNTIGTLYRKRGRVSRRELAAMEEIAWRRCVLCTRCYCPFGIDIPDMISLARSVLRSQGICPDFGGSESP